VSPDATGAASNGARIEYLSAVAETACASDWYDLSDEAHFWMQWRLAVVLRLIRASGLSLDEPLRALDIGGGVGRFRAQLERATSWRVDMTDLNLPALRMAGPARGRTLYYDVTQASRPILGAYDACFLLDVIEHMRNPTLLIRAAVEHLRPGGRLFVNVPALQRFFSAYDVAMGHERRYSKETLAAEFAGLPCRLTAVQYWGFALLPLLALRWLLTGRRPRPHTIRAGFKPPSALVNEALKALMKAELALLQAPPLGISVMAAAVRLD
jgi:2-polyprenyl-3-methyl-5-hydroxy-6-metoxy-1,4-benzoquinol methylase